MNGRTAAEAAGITAGTLNVWVSRGLIPGASVGSKGGRPRRLDFEAAANVCIVADLVRHGTSAPVAGHICEQRMSYWAACGTLVVASPPIQVVAALAGKVRARQIYSALARTPIVLGFMPGVDVVEALPRSFPQGKPTVMTIIDVDAIRERLRPLEEQDGLDLERDEPTGEVPADNR